MEKVGKKMKAVALVFLYLLTSNCVFGIKAKWDSDKSNWSPLMVAAYNDDVKGMRLLLIKNNINEQNKEGTTALMIAARKGNRKAVKFLLTHHADPNLFDTYDDNALFIACENNNVKVIKLLFEYDVNPQYQIKGYTPLMIATIFSTVRVMRVLIKNGIDVNSRDNIENKTALGFASFFLYESNKYKRKCRFLKRKGAIM